MESPHHYIRLAGAPYDRGLQYGRAAKERIFRVIEEYKVLFDKEARIGWEEAWRRAAPYREPISAFRPDLIEEMQGLADGAGIDLQTVILMNARSEVMFSENDDSCTVIGVPPEASEDGGALLAQNWDWWSIGGGTTVILEIEQPPYPKALIITEAGLVGGKGLNECGIGVSLNAMSVKKAKKGVPLHILLRGAISQRTLPKAIDVIARAKRAGGANIGLASADGLLVMIEAAPSDLDILLSGGRVLCHTNHWLSMKMILGGEATNYSYTSTFTRLDRARRLSEAAGKLNPAKLFGIFGDHAGSPDSICRHADPAIPVYHRHTSLWSMVLDVKNRTIWLTDGSPCRTEARAYRLG